MQNLPYCGAGATQAGYCQSSLMCISIIWFLSILLKGRVICFMLQLTMFMSTKVFCCNLNEPPQTEELSPRLKHKLGAFILV